MERTFTYRTAQALAVPVFFVVWGGLLAAIAVSARVSGQFTINGRLASPAELQQDTTLMVLVGCAVVLLIPPRFLFTWKNERVSLTDSEVVWIDWRGQERLRTSRAGIKMTSGPSSGTATACVFQTKHGELRITRNIRDFAVLRDLLLSGGQITTAFDQSAVGQLPSPHYQPERKTYRYCGSLLHLFSFIWLGAIGFMVVALAKSGQAGQLSSIAFLIGLLGFAAVGIWMQLTGWVESITLGPDGIRWVDWLGRVKVDATLAEIRGSDRASGNNLAVLKIFTTKGTIQASSYLWGFSNLAKEVQKVLESRPTES